MFLVDPRCINMGRPDHYSSKRTYTVLLALHPTAFKRAGMGSREIGGVDRDGGGVA